MAKSDFSSIPTWNFCVREMSLCEIS